MSTGASIEELLKADDEALRAKRKRLNGFAKALEDARSAMESARELAQEILDSGDLTRTEFTRVFGLSSGERSAVIPPARRRSKRPADQADHEEPQPHETSAQEY